MTFIYRVQVELSDGDIRTWYESVAGDAESIKESVARTLHNCKVEGSKVTVQLGN